MCDDKEYHKKYYEENYEKLKEYRKQYYKGHKQYYKDKNKEWLAKKRKAPLKCVICGGGLPDTNHSFKYCYKCVKEGKTSRQVRHLRKKELV